MSYTERRFAGKTKAELNKGSPHNSYYMILAENGIWGMFCVAILTFIPVLGFIYKILINDKLYYSDLASAGLLGISIHWYSIASFMGGVTWLCIALAIISRKLKY
jgi:O-antigen ligase